MSNAFDSVLQWWSRRRERSRRRQIEQHIAVARHSVDLTECSGCLYIAHNGVGIRRLEPSLTVAEAISILEEMRSHTAQWVGETATAPVPTPSFV